MTPNIKKVFMDSVKLFEDARKGMRETAILTAKIVLCNTEKGDLRYSDLYKGHELDEIYLEDDSTIIGIFLNASDEPAVRVLSGPLSDNAIYTFSELSTNEVCEIATYLCNYHSDKM